MPVINNGSQHDRIMRLQNRTIYTAFLIEKQAVDDKKLIRGSFAGIEYARYTPLRDGPLLFTPDELTAIVANNRTLDGNNVIVYAMIVSSFVGSGIAGFSDGPLANASFYAPMGAVFDASGNMYVTDTDNNRIRKISPSGVVTTYAGSGIAGFTNGDASSATFKSPIGIAIDAIGNIYVADSGNNAIRIIYTDGRVDTVAGTGIGGFSNSNNPALSIFNNPTGIVVDSSGNIYVSDSANNMIRKITQSSAGVASSVSTLTNGVSTTIPPSDSYQFNNPQGLALDSTGNLYIADKGNNTIRTIDLDVLPLVVKTLAGSPSPPPGSPASAGSIDGTGDAARFNGPTGIVVDSQGNIFVTDTNNNTIRKITNTGQTTTFGGPDQNSSPSDGSSVTSEFSFPTGLTIDPLSGNLYVVDTGNNSIKKIIVYNIALPPPVNLPGAVSDLKAYPGNGFVNLTWTAPESEDLAITGYSIRITPPRQLPEVPIIVRAPDTFLKITGLSNSTVYTFTVSAITSLGLSPSDSITSTPISTLTASAPEAPTLSCYAGNKTVIINWTHRFPLTPTGYKITVTTGTTPIVVFTTNTFDTDLREYTIRGLTNGTVYSVSVYAFNNYGISPAATESVTPIARTEPPVFIKSSSALNSVTLEWVPNTPLGVNEPSSFRIYYIGSDNINIEYFASIDNSGTRIYTIPGLTNNIEYTFRITSRNDKGESPRSIPVRQTPNPRAPSVITVSGLIPKDQSAFVEWSVPYNGGSPITSYTITATDSSGESLMIFDVADSTLLNLEKDSSASFKVNGLTNGTTYRFIVTANNGYGRNKGLLSNSTVFPSKQLPDVSTDFTAIPGNSSVTLFWKVPDVNSWSIPHGQVITEYKIVVCDSSGQEVEPEIVKTLNPSTDSSILNAVARAPVSYTVSSLTNNFYRFKIASKNDLGYSSYVFTAVPVRPNVPTAAPTQLTVIPKYQSAFVSWTPPTTDPSVGIPNVSDYTITVYDASGTSVIRTIPLVSASSSSFTVSSLTNDTQYKISIIANNSAGASPETSKVPVIPAIQIPDIITNVSLAPIYSGTPTIKVNWTAPVSSGSSSITSYTIRYYDTYGVLKGIISVPTTSPEGTYPYFTYTITHSTDTPLVHDINYTATVTAYNGIYDSPEQSIELQTTTNTLNNSLIAAMAAGNPNDVTTAYNAAKTNIDSVLISSASSASSSNKKNVLIMAAKVQLNVFVASVSNLSEKTKLQTILTDLKALYTDVEGTNDPVIIKFIDHIKLIFTTDASKAKTALNILSSLNDAQNTLDKANAVQQAAQTMSPLSISVKDSTTAAKTAALNTYDSIKARVDSINSATTDRLDAVYSTVFVNYQLILAKIYNSTAESSSVSYVNENIALINAKAAYDTAIPTSLKVAYDTLMMAQTNVVESSIENLNSAQDAVEAAAALAASAPTSSQRTTAVTTAATLLANAQAAARSTANTYVANMQSIYHAAVSALDAVVASGNAKLAAAVAVGNAEATRTAASENAAAISTATAKKDVAATNFSIAQTNNTNVLALIAAQNAYNGQTNSIDKNPLTKQKTIAITTSSANADVSYTQAMYNAAVSAYDSSIDAQMAAALASRASSTGFSFETAEIQLVNVKSSNSQIDANEAPYNFSNRVSTSLTNSITLLVASPKGASAPDIISKLNVSLDSSFYDYPIITWNIPYYRSTNITKYKIYIYDSLGALLSPPFPSGLTSNTIEISATTPAAPALGSIPNIQFLITRTQKTFQIPSIFPYASSYKFKMTSTNTVGESGESAFVTLVTRPTKISPAPVISRVSGTNSVNIKWTHSTTVTGGRIAKYTINSINFSNNDLLSSIDDISGSVNETTLNSIPYGITFTSTVYATDENGIPSKISEPSNPLIISIRASQITPSAVDTNNGAIIYWQVPDNQGNEISSYKIYAYTSENEIGAYTQNQPFVQEITKTTEYMSIFNAQKGETVYAVFTGLTNLKYYKFKITGVNIAGSYDLADITNFSNVIFVDIKCTITTLYHYSQNTETEKDYYCALDSTGNYMYQYSNIWRKLLKIDTTKIYTTSNINSHIEKYTVYTSPTSMFPYTFGEVLGMCMDSTGAIFVVNGNTIVKIMYENNRYVGRIVAGKTNPGFNSENTIRGLAAEFNTIRAIASDKTDNLYVTDNGNSRIRKLTKYILNENEISRDNDPYNVTTIYGSGTGNIDMYGITVDSNFNVYIAENNVIRKLKINTEKTAYTVSTIAGSASTEYTDGIGEYATFGALRGITVDSFGNLYVTDNKHKRICIITPNSNGTSYRTSTIFRDISTNISPTDISTPTIDSYLAINVKGNVRNIQGISVDPENNIFIVSTGYVTIRKIKILTGLGVLLQGNKYVNGSGTWIDQTGNTNNASLISSNDILTKTLQPGSSLINNQGNAIVLDGKSAWNLKPPNMRSNWTASVWFKHTGTPIGEKPMIFSSQAGVNRSIYFYIGDLNSSSGGVGSYQVGFYNSETYSSIDFTPGDQWVNIVGVYDAEIRTLKTYINGSVYHNLYPEKSPIYIGYAGPSDASGYIIGGYLEGEKSFVVGEIGEVRLYNYPRSQGEVTADYNESAPTFSVLKQPANIVYTDKSFNSIRLRWSGGDTATSYSYSINGITSGMMLATGVGTGSTSMKYSIDGEVWNNTVGGFSTLANGSAWCKYFWTLVAVGQGDSSIKYSFNGINWYNATGGFSTSGKGIAWNNVMPTTETSTDSIMVAVGTDASNNTIKYSENGGRIWKNGTGMFIGSGNGVAVSGTRWVAVGSDSLTDTIKYSNDGKNWNTSSRSGSTLFTTSGNGVAVSGTRWVAVGIDTGNQTIKYSIDGIIWANATGSLFIGYGNGVAFNGVDGGGSMWVAVGNDASGNTIKYSSDGISWTTSSKTSGSTLFANEGTGVTWNSVLKKWFATGIDTSGNTIKTSPDGITWTNINGVFNTRANSVSSVAQFITLDAGTTSKSAVVSISRAIVSYTSIITAISGTVKRVSAPFELIRRKPTIPILNTTPLSDITETSITITWTGGDGATSYSFSAIDTSLLEDPNNANYQTETTRQSIIASVDNSLTYKQAIFTRLKPNVTYNFMVTARNSDGENSSIYTDVSSIKTLQIPPPPFKTQQNDPYDDVPPFDYRIIAPTPTGFLIKWNSTSNIIDSFKYYLSTSPIQDTILLNEVFPIAHDIAKGYNWIGAFAYIGDLEPDKDYYLIAKAINALGSVYSDTINIKTTKKEKVLYLKASNYSGTGQWADESGKQNYATPHNTNANIYRKNPAGNGIVINLDIPGSFNSNPDGLSWRIKNPKLNNTWTINIWYKCTGFDNLWNVGNLYKKVFAQLGVEGTKAYPLYTNASIIPPYSFGNSKNFSMNIESIASFENPTIGSGNILSSSIGPIGYRYIHGMSYLRRIGGENTWYNFQYTWDGQYLSTYVNGVLIGTYRNKTNNPTENRLENNPVLLRLNEVEGKPASTTLFNNIYNDTSGQRFEMPTNIFSSGTYNGFCISEDNGEDYAVGRFYGEIGEISAYSYARTPLEITADYFASVRTYKDANVYVVKYNTDLSVKWTRLIRGFTNDFPIKKLVDTEGNVYVSGSYNSSTLYIYDTIGEIKFSLTNPGIESTYLVKYDMMNGTPLWARNIGGPTGSARVVDMKFDTVSTNIYICGYFSCPKLNVYNSNEMETTSFYLTNPIADNTYIAKHVFTVKYHADGTPQWARKVGGNNFFVYPTNIDIDSTGNVYACVESKCNTMYIYNESNTITFSVDNSYVGMIRTCIIKYSASGTPMSFKMIEHNGDTISNNNNKTDSNGNTYLTLEYLNTITASSVIEKYDTSGANVWTKNIVSGVQAQHLRPMNTIIDTFGNVYVSFTDPGISPINVYDESNITPKYSFSFANHTNFNVVNTACFIKYNSIGLVQWANIIRNVLSYSSLKHKIVSAYDSGGNMYVSGNFTGGYLNIYNVADLTKPYMILKNNTTLLPGTSSEASSDIFIIKYGTSGTPLWARKIGGTSEDMVVSIVADSTNNNVYVSGNFTSPILNMYDYVDNIISDFSLSNSTPEVNQGFIIKYDMNGSVIASRKIVNSIGSGNNTLVTTMMDSSGNLHVSGYSNSVGIILTPPAAPTDISAVPDDYTDTSIKLSWTPPTSGTATIPLIQKYGINIYKKPGIDLANIIVNTGTSCIVPGLTTGTLYEFSINAINSIGYSPDSTPVVAATPISKSLAAPTNFTATLSGDQATSVILSWTAPLFGNRPITGYIIKQSINDQAETELSGTNFISPYTIPYVLTGGSRYKYTIKAINGSTPETTNVAISREVTAETTATPTITSIVPSTTAAIVNFSVAHGARVSTILYRLYDVNTLVATLTQSDIRNNLDLLQFTGITMDADRLYRYSIKTFNDSDMSTALSVSDTVQSTHFTVKANVVTNVVANIVNSGFANVTWSPATLPPSATTILYYIVRAYTFNPNNSLTEYVSSKDTWSKDSTSFDYPNLINGVSYKFTVKAVNRAGENTESSLLNTVAVKPSYTQISSQRLQSYTTSTRDININSDITKPWTQGFAAFDFTRQYIYISDIEGKVPYKFDISTKGVTQISVDSMEGVGKTYGIVLDSWGNIYLSSIDTSTITKLTLENGTYKKGIQYTFTELNNSQIIGLAIDNTNNIIFASVSDASGNVYIYTMNNNLDNRTVIYTYTSSVPTRTPTPIVPAQPPEPTANLGPARGIALDSYGNLYITDANHTIRKLTKTGTIYNGRIYVGEDGSPGKTDGPIAEARVTSPFAITVDSSGNVYFVDYDGIDGNSKKTIRMIYSKNGQQYVTTLFTLENSSRSNHIWGLLVDSSKNLYACYKEDDHIWKLFINDVTIPSPVIGTSIIGYPGKGSVTLYWSPPIYNGTSKLTLTNYTGYSPITSYTIIYYAGPSYDIPSGQVIISQTEGNAALLASITPSYIVTGLENGTSYKFAVVSRNYLGNSEISPLSAVASTPINAITPSFPQITSASTGDPGQSTVIWNAPTSNGGAEIKSYTVTSYPDGITKDVYGASNTTATVTGLRGGTQYRFTVVATNLAGNSSPSLLYPSLLSPAVTPSIAPPSIPQNLTATLSGVSATDAILSWFPSTGSIGYPVTGYTITAINTTTVTQREYPNISSSHPYTTTIPELLAGNSYKFKIRSENTRSSEYSAETSPIRAGTTAVPLITSVDQTDSTNKKVNFSVAYGARITGIKFKLYSLNTSNNQGTYLAVATQNDISSNDGILQVTGISIATGTTYTFYMTYQKDMQEESLRSNTFTVTGVSVPSTVSSVSLTPQDSSILLNWIAPSANGSSIRYYTITAYSADNTIVSTQNTSGASISFNYTGLFNGVSYKFKIQGVNEIGTGTLNSNFSEVATPFFTVQSINNTFISFPTNSFQTGHINSGLMTYDENTNRLYVVDTDERIPCVIQLNTDGTLKTYNQIQTTSTYQGSNKAENAYQPYGVDVDASNNMYLAVFGSNNITKFTYNIDTKNYTQAVLIAGTVNNVKVKFDSPYGIAIDSTETYAYFTEQKTLSGKSGPRVFRINIRETSPTETELFTLSGVLRGIILDSSDNMYIAAAGTNVIYKAIYTGNGGIYNTPYVYAGGSLNVNGTNNGKALDARLSDPKGMAINSRGNIVFIDGSTTPNIRIVYTGSDNMNYVANVNVSGISSQAIGIAIDSNDNIYVANRGASPPTISKFRIIIAPSPPTDVSATGGNAQATVSWTTPKLNGGYAITSYRVTSPGGISMVVSGASTTTATVTGLTNGTTYTFTVVATNSVGDSSPSLASNSVTPKTVPGSPIAVSAVPGNTQATVTWTEPRINGGATITSYRVISSAGGISMVVSGASTTTATVTGLTNGTPYTFTVVAINSVGDSSPSLASNSVTPIMMGLKAWYVAADYSGSGAWADKTGSGNSATILFGTAAKTSTGNAVVFDGSTSWTFPNVAVGNAWSVSVWYKKYSTATGNSVILSQKQTGANNIFISDTNGNNTITTGFKPISDNTLRQTTGTPITQELWTNIQTTWDGTTLRMYLNGVLNSSSTPGGTSADSGTAYILGSDTLGGQSNFIRGEIAEVRIYNRALSQAEVTNIYSTTLGPVTGVRAWFTASGYSGSGAWLDKSGYGNNATADRGTITLNSDRNGLSLDGSRSMTFSNTKVGNSWTITAWYRITGAIGTGASILTQITSGTVNPNATLGYISGTNLSAGFANANTWTNGGTIGLMTNVWTNIHATWDGANIRSYINGALVSTVSSSTTAVDNNLGYRIGASWNTNTSIIGELGVLRMYNRALTQAEITSEYEAEAKAFLP